MHEPACRCGFAAVKAFAIKPETMAGFVFDEVIVAAKAPSLSLPRLRGRVGWGRAPPFIGDPVRALRAGDVVSHAAPAQTPRRIVGNERGDFGRLGLRQQ